MHTANEKTRAIVCFIEDKRFLIEQALALRESWLYSECTDTDLVIMGPAIALAGIPDDVVKIEQRPVSGDPEWLAYECSNSIACMNGENARILDRYSHILRSDVDTFVTPAWNSFRPDEFVYGRGFYSDPAVSKNIRRIADDFGLLHRGLTNVGSTWYGPTALVRRACALSEMLLRHILLNEFGDQQGQWPGWWRGVSLLYASEIAINHLVPNAMKTDQLDAFSTHRKPIESFAHIHCWHTDDKFSKHWFYLDRYTQADAMNLDLNIIPDYAMEMSVRAIRPRTLRPAPGTLPAADERGGDPTVTETATS
jgi:hypothetical protein